MRSSRPLPALGFSHGKPPLPVAAIQQYIRELYYRLCVVTYRVQQSTRSIEAPMNTPSKLENLLFVRAMLKEIRNRTVTEDEGLLTHLIDMAYYEADDQIRNQQDEPRSNITFPPFG